MIQFKVDGRQVAVRDGATILEALPDLPALCHDARLAPLGICRLCLVEIEGHERPAPACMTAATAGMHVTTNAEALREELTLLARGLPSNLPDSELRRSLDRY